MPVTLIAILSLLRLTAQAQASVDDGVRAMLRGDYRTAATVFRPLSEGPDADPAAQFLLAVLHLSGQGGASGQGNACSLFTRVATSTHLLAQPAMEIADAMREEMGPGGMLLCRSDPSARPIPASFTLGPGHRVDILDSSIVVTYNGIEKRTANDLPPGWIPLPTRYTPVDVMRPTPGRRHFLHTNAWWRDPLNGPSVWRLGWMVSEVVGADLLLVTGDPSVMTSTDEKPPAGVDLDRLFRLFVNTAGDIEWNVGTGDAVRRGIIAPREPK